MAVILINLFGGDINVARQGEYAGLRLNTRLRSKMTVCGELP